MSNYVDHYDKKGSRYEIVSKPLSDSIADEFSKSKSYQIGDLVMYEGMLYSCKAAKSAGDWNDTYFEAYQLSSLKDADAVKYDQQQFLTDAEKKQARVNVGAVSSSSIAEEFSISKAYAIDDIVMYQGQLYKFKVAHSAGVWNVSHVSEVTVMDEVGALNSDLKTLFEEISLTFIQGTINSAYGTFDASNHNRIATDDYVDVVNRTIFAIPLDFDYSIFFYKDKIEASLSNYISTSGFINGKKVLGIDIQIPEAAKLYKLVVKYNSGISVPIIPSDFVGYSVLYNISNSINKELESTKDDLELLVEDTKDDLELLIEDKSLYTRKEISTDYVQGSLNSVYGTLDTSSNIRIATLPILIESSEITVTVDDKYDTNVFFYGTSDFSRFKGMSDWKSGSYVIGEDVPIPLDSNYVRLSIRLRATPTGAISPSTVAEGEIVLSNVYKKLDESDLKQVDSLFVPSNYPNIVYLCRDGRVTNDIPPNSVYAIKATAENQYDKIRISVSKTTDGEYVAVHDVTINNLAVNPDGSAISTTINTQGCSLAELNNYDWGLKFGTQYAGLNVPMLEDCLKYASMYNLTVALDIKWTVTDDDIDNIVAILAKYGQLDAILFAVSISAMQKFQVKNKRLSYLFAGTYEQMQSQSSALALLLSGYNKIYLAYRPMGTAPTTDVINLATANNFDIMYSPIEGLNALITLGFDKGVTLMECHYITNIKKTVRDYVNTLIQVKLI